MRLSADVAGVRFHGRYVTQRTVRAGIDAPYLKRYVTDPAAAGQPPAHFQRNPLGRSRLAVPSGGRRTRCLRIDLDMLESELPAMCKTIGLRPPPISRRLELCCSPHAFLIPRRTFCQHRYFRCFGSSCGCTLVLLSC